MIESIHNTVILLLFIINLKTLQNYVHIKHNIYSYLHIIFYNIYTTKDIDLLVGTKLACRKCMHSVYILF